MMEENKQKKAAPEGGAAPTGEPRQGREPRSEESGRDKDGKCPLCKVSEESLRVLKTQGRQTRPSDKTKPKGGLWHKLLKK